MMNLLFFLSFLIFWKNKLYKYKPNTWIGFCQKRRFWLKKNTKFKRGNIHLVLRAQKKDYATSDEKPNVLIDDYIKNIKKKNLLAKWIHLPFAGLEDYKYLKNFYLYIIDMTSITYLTAFNNLIIKFNYTVTFKSTIN